MNWKFDQGPNVAAMTTKQVIQDNLPILRVIHYLDDHSWAFLCGTTDNTEDGRMISMAQALELDPSLQKLAILPPGWKAWRDTVDSAWKKEKINEEIDH